MPIICYLKLWQFFVLFTCLWGNNSKRKCLSTVKSCFQTLYLKFKNLFFYRKKLLTDHEADMITFYDSHNDFIPLQLSL